MEARMPELRSHARLIWSIADHLRGPYKRSEYGRVILPFALMRRLDQVMEDTKDEVVAEAERLRDLGTANLEDALQAVAGRQFFNLSPLRFSQLAGDHRHLRTHVLAYVDGFSELARKVFSNFDLEKEIDKLDRHGLLHLVIGRMSEVDLHPKSFQNLEMGYIFEELIRRFAEQSNDEAGEHFTPREVVQLMVNLLLAGDEEVLAGRGVIRTVLDCACGTGGMLSETEAHIKGYNPKATVQLFGQELNEQSYAICLADMLVRDQDASHIVLGNSLTLDGHKNLRFHYGIANPPFGRDWKAEYPLVKGEFDEQGEKGRFGPGLPGKDDGQVLFMLHLLAKMRDPDDGGGRVCIVHNGAPLTSGGAGSGLSEIRRHLIENDLLEAIVALPEQLFYNTGITTYVWVLTNRKPEHRKGFVQLIDARDRWVRMTRSLGEKRREIAPRMIDEITGVHSTFVDGPHVKVLANETFAYRRVTVNRPLRGRWTVEGRTFVDVDAEGGPLDGIPDVERRAGADALQRLPKVVCGTEDEAKELIRQAAEPYTGRLRAPALRALIGLCFERDPDADPQVDRHGELVPDPSLRDVENVPLVQDVEDYLDREVRPWAPDAYVEDIDGKLGYEIPFTQLFHRPAEPRPSDELRDEIRQLEQALRTATETLLG